MWQIIGGILATVCILNLVLVLINSKNSNPLDSTDGYVSDLHINPSTDSRLSALESLISENIPFFLFERSLLSWARERRFFKNSVYLDIGININDLTKTGLKFALMDWNLVIDTDYFMKFELDNYHINIFILTENDMSGYSYYRQDSLLKSISMFDLETINFMGMQISIPDNHPLILEEIYGRSWRLP